MKLFNNLFNHFGRAGAGSILLSGIVFRLSIALSLLSVLWSTLFIYF
ncbi:hypothetical protein [Psychromonas aquimarina]|nr:hypothetical protein [Psychromonas aquimarina]